jgi:uncharacterized protein YraI
VVAVPTVVQSRRRASLGLPLAAIGMLLAGCAQTSIPRLSVRSGPGRGYQVVASIPDSGTAVAVTCWLRGAPVHGDRVWYRIESPRSGYVTNYYISKPGDYAGAPHC